MICFILFHDWVGAGDGLRLTIIIENLMRSVLNAAPLAKASKNVDHEGVHKRMKIPPCGAGSVVCSIATMKAPNILPMIIGI